MITCYNLATQTNTISFQEWEAAARQQASIMDSDIIAFDADDEVR